MRHVGYFQLLFRNFAVVSSSRSLFSHSDIIGNLSFLLSPSELTHGSENVFFSLPVSYLPMSCLCNLFIFFWKGWRCWCNYVKCQSLLGAVSIISLTVRMGGTAWYHVQFCVSETYTSKQQSLGSETGLWVNTAWRWISLLIWYCLCSCSCLVAFLRLFWWLTPLSALYCFISAPFSSLHCTSVLLWLAFLFCPLDLTLSLLVVARGCICQERSKDLPLCIGNRAVIHFCCVYTAA